MALEVYSVPLSLTMAPGRPRGRTMLSSSRATLRPDSDVSATRARHSRVQLSITVRMRKRRPSVIWSETKSRLQRLLAARGVSRPLAPAAAPHRQPLLTVDPLDALPVDRMALAPQQHMQPPIAEAPSLLGQGLQAFAQRSVIRPPGVITHAGSVGADHPARPPLAHLVGRLQISRSLPMRGGRHHFFPRRSFSATLSSIASASIRLSLAFSSSSAFNRRASDTSSPPNLAFHL